MIEKLMTPIPALFRFHGKSFTILLTKYHFNVNPSLTNNYYFKNISPQRHIQRIFAAKNAKGAKV